ncbi:MAG: dTDP-4-dehydrorhamnose 3,5-epimerase [Bacteroidota bacterium]|jgi:dTDP-4-dehydrorhamnose 3,5-epimerase
MKISETLIEGLKIIEPKVFQDDRGYFFESWSKKIFEENNIEADFLQDNQSLSTKGVLRGLHFQSPPYAQGKLVRVIKGSVLDVAVDIRKRSPTYGQHVCVELSEKNKLQFYIPPGFAHGFLTLEDETIFSYKCTNYYNKDSEGTILWNDPEIGIDWKITHPRISQKDEAGILLKNFKSPF